MDGFDVLEQLGEGSSGEAFLVQSKKTGARHVLKRIRTDCLTAVEKESAEREAVLLRSLDHPNITKFEGSFISPEDGSVNILMEACEMTLDHLLEAMRQDQAEAIGVCGLSPSASPAVVGFPESVLLEWMAELASALHYLHSRRVLHRDIKPSNIFVSKTHHLKIGDFGVSKVLSKKSLVANSVVGTPLYIAPEVLQDEPYDDRSDVWSLGVSFYEFCTLQRPFGGDNFLSVVREITTKEPARVSKVRPGLDVRFDEVILPMLNKDPRRRVKSEDVLKHFVVQQNHPSHPSQDPKRSRVCQDTYKVELTLPRSLHRDRSASASSQLVEVTGPRGPSPPEVGSQQLNLSPQESTPAIVCPPSSGKQQATDRNALLGPKPQATGQKPLPPPSRVAPVSSTAAPSSKDKSQRRTSLPQVPGGPSGSAAMGLTSQEEHARRVREARSKINMRDLRQRWTASQSSSVANSEGEGGAGAGFQVLVPRHPQSPEAAVHVDPNPPAEASPRVDAASEPDSRAPGTPPRASLAQGSVNLVSHDGSLGAFLEDLLRQLDGPQLTLEAVDEAGMVLLEFKKRRFGTY
jgi:serine/threonine protein kinase